LNRTAFLSLSLSSRFDLVVAPQYWGDDMIVATRNAIGFVELFHRSRFSRNRKVTLIEE